MTSDRTARRSATRAFRQCRDGMAAVEFGLVLPILLTLYFGLFETTRAIDLARKTTLFTRSVADLTGQLPAQVAGKAAAVSSSDMNGIYAGASAILSPFDSSAVQIVVSAIGVNLIKGKLVGRVCSSYAQNATARPDLQVVGTNGLPAIPATYNFDGARYLLAEVTMPYAPVLGTTIYSSIFGNQGLTFTRQIAWAERNGEVVLPPKATLCPTT